MFHPISKHSEVGWQIKILGTPRFLNPVLGVLKSDETLIVFNTLLQSPIAFVYLSVNSNLPNV